MKNKVLFVHDGPLYVDENKEYYGVHYKNKIVERYSRLGEDVTFLMRLNSITSYAATKLNKITCSNFSFVSIPNFKRLTTYFKEKSNAKKIIEATVLANDVIVVRMPSAAGVIAIQVARQLNKPYLVEMVACTFDAYWNYGWKGKLIAHYTFFKVKKIIKNCPFVVYVTNNFLQNRYPTNGVHINISNVELQAIVEVDLLKRKDKINNTVLNQPLIIGTVAAIDVPYKGQADVIKALAILKKEGIVFYYHIVGQGNPKILTDLIDKLDLTDQIKIIGSLEHSKVFDFYQKIDLYIQPSKQEGLPRALIEAMSKAVPALGARTAGIPELLDEKSIFEPGNCKEIAFKLKSIDQAWMLENAERNFITAKDYQIHILEEKRRDFYQLFLNSIQN